MDPEAVPYRSPVDVGVAEVASTEDENDFSSLKDVKRKFDKAIAELYKDFNAFDITKLLDSPTLDEAAKKLLVSIMAKQEAYDILTPLRDQLDSAIKDVKQKQER